MWNTSHLFVSTSAHPNARKTCLTYTHTRTYTHSWTYTQLRCCCVKLFPPTATASRARTEEAAGARAEEEVWRDGAAPPRGGEEARRERAGTETPDWQVSYEGVWLLSTCPDSYSDERLKHGNAHLTAQIWEDTTEMMFCSTCKMRISHDAGLQTPGGAVERLWYLICNLIINKWALRHLEQGKGT